MRTPDPLGQLQFGSAFAESRWFTDFGFTFFNQKWSRIVKIISYGDKPR